MRMATMAAMIAPKGTVDSWNGGNVEYSPVPVGEGFSCMNGTYQFIIILGVQLSKVSWD